ncbi:hypothetical protein MKZ38_007637 [Zalerion maritima]|uniref:RAVE complex protein Rav1 C-terminal domain-containing protein n=1 Tax=Zalerion maritima TaxID=339359 RepID=A0AAD5RYK9_9PEZI|nr:hypothetical protein MKZ38_007637 [Zalerion maritima]
MWPKDMPYLRSMKAILPGKPEARLQALATGFWDGRRIIAYVSGNTFAILSDPETLIQTVCEDDDDNEEQSLQAIAIDEASGKIAVCTCSVARVYAPLRHGRFQLKWVFEAQIRIPDDDCSTAPCLSWGSSEELLIAQETLRLYKTGWKIPECRWEKPLANPVKFATISYDSNYVACVGYHDRLVKVWRRFGGNSFDFSYLRHPGPITGLQWRQPHDSQETLVNVLYTFCADNILRIWSGGGRMQHIRFWGQLDLGSSIQDRCTVQNGDIPHRRYAFIINSRDFESSATKAIADGVTDGDSISHLATVAKRTPELCMTFDGLGNMSAWGFENVGYNTKPNIFNVAHVQSHDLCFLKDVPAGEVPHMEICNYSNKVAGHLHVLLHYFDGRIQVFESNIGELLTPTPNECRMTMRCIWSGHSAPIRKMVRNYSGRAIVSRTAGGESIVWRHPEKKTKLSRWSMIPETGQIHRICVLRKGRFVLFLMRETVCLWDCRQKQAQPLGQCNYRTSGKPLCIVILPRQHREDFAIAHVATVTSDNDGIVWEVLLPLYSNRRMKTQNGEHVPGIKEFCRFRLPGASDLAYVLPVDPAGATPVESGFLDVFARDVAISWTHGGNVEFWTARVNVERAKVEWLSTASFDTGVSRPALAGGSTMKKAALVNTDRTEVSIWDIKGARLEWAQTYEDENIHDLDWTSTPDSQSILAIGFESRVVLLSQMRFDYLNKGPAWAAIREININSMTPRSIGDSTWLGDGHLVIGVGNQLYMYGRQFEMSSHMLSDLRFPGRKHGEWDLFDVVQRLNGPLPVFHPQFLSQCTLAGKTQLMNDILMALHKVLKFYVDGDVIDDHLGMDLSEFYLPTDAYKAGKDSGSLIERRGSVPHDSEPFSEEAAEYIREKLQRIALPQLSAHEQIQLVDIVECAGVVEKQRRSMDENGARFMLFFRQHALRKGRTNEIHLSWRELVWAHHSNCQDILVDFITQQCKNLTWESARESGMFMWLSDSAAVVSFILFSLWLEPKGGMDDELMKFQTRQFEIIARNEYTKSEWKNPIDCSLHYLALKKKTVLQGLWRMAAWNREQIPTMKLLAHDFNEAKWKTTALKNAYALLSKHRFGQFASYADGYQPTKMTIVVHLGCANSSFAMHVEYAAAFFLLADRLQDAVNVCLHQLKDLQLAIAIARVYEGDTGPVLRKLLEDDVLALAAQEGNRWLASWAFWMLNRKDMAVRSLITPVYNLIETPMSPERRSKLFLADDPALVVLYSQLRQKTLQTLRGASKVSPRTEWEFVLHNARLYDRMGCDLLGLDLVRNWEFLHPTSGAERGLGGEIMDPRSLLKRRQSHVVADLPVGGGFGGFGVAGGRNGQNGKVVVDVGSEKTKTKKKQQQQQQPTMFTEPDANSLLDSFGF